MYYLRRFNTYTLQVNSIAKIYLNSYLTLFAANKVDAELGLHSILSCTTP